MSVSDPVVEVFTPPLSVGETEAQKDCLKQNKQTNKKDQEKEQIRVFTSQLVLNSWPFVIMPRTWDQGRPWIFTQNRPLGLRQL